MRASDWAMFRENIPRTKTEICKRGRVMAKKLEIRWNALAVTFAIFGYGLAAFLLGALL